MDKEIRKKGQEREKKDRMLRLKAFFVNAKYFKLIIILLFVVEMSSNKKKELN